MNAASNADLAVSYQQVLHDVSVEQALLGAILADNKAIGQIGGSLRPEYFYDPLNGRIFETITQMYERNITVTALTLHAAMRLDPDVVEAGGHRYFDALLTVTPSIPNICDYANIIADLALRRSLIDFGERLINSVNEAATETSCGKLIDEYEQALNAVREKYTGTAHETPVLNSADFVAGFSSPDYVWDGILQRGFLYSLTARTGAGKTAILLRLMAHVALGRALGGRGVFQGRALMLVGENADDVRARWIALTEHLGVLPCELDVDFMPGVFSIEDNFSRIRARAEMVGGYALVGVDTSAAYFTGDEENSNKQLGDHARVLRTLTRLPGTPCVVSPCHPTKGAAEDNLLPRGGGSFIAEVDGNLTGTKKTNGVEVHWQGKFRGPDFEPMAFEMRTVTSDRLTDSKGRSVPSVVAVPITDAEQMQRANAENSDLMRLIAVMSQNPGVSLATLAERADWYGSDGKPAKSKVQRLVGVLNNQNLAAKVLNTWALTSAGNKIADRRSL